MKGARTLRAATLLGTAMAVGTLALAPLAVVAKEGDIIHQGSCTGSTDWKLKLSEEDGAIEVEFEVDENQNGHTWDVKLRRNGNVVWIGQRTTKAPSGSFEARRVISDGAGADKIVARATYGGEVCRGTATFSA